MEVWIYSSRFRQLLNVNMSPLYFETNYNRTISLLTLLVCPRLMVGMATRASKNRIIRSWGRGNINSLDLQYRDKCQWRWTEFTQMPQECLSSRELTQCNKSTRVVDSDRCGMTAESRSQAPVKTHCYSHARCVRPTPDFIMSVRLWFNAHWFALQPSWLK